MLDQIDWVLFYKSILIAVVIVFIIVDTFIFLRSIIHTNPIRFVFSLLILLLAITLVVLQFIDIGDLLLDRINFIKI